jgi:flagellum-specific peptidoglycan hydrolase FlgJ
MIKKIVPLFMLLILIGCNASKPVIVTKKTVSHTAKKETIQTSKKTVSVAKHPKNESSVSSTEIIESTSKTVVTSDLINGYVFHYKDIAMNNMRNFGIPASIILAQGILESGSGIGDLAVSANNHFGIKCHKDWTGESVRHNDDSDQECFRKYNDPAESFQDHALFLNSRPRYASLFQLPKGDYKAWAQGLRTAGYATDPKYPEKLINYIERYNLYQYDNQVLGKAFVIDTNQNIQPIKTETVDLALYEVQKGDTLYSISKKFNLLVEDLKQKNDLIENTLSIGQKLKVK